MKKLRKIPRNGLWSIVIILSILLVGETIICKEQLKSTFKYYKDKVVEIYNDFSNRGKVREEMSEFLNCEIPEKTIAIFEPNPYHHECMPGYAKYFTDLGYNVDVLINEDCEDSMELFEPKEKLRIFTFKNFDYIKCIHSDLSKKFAKYDNTLLHSSDPCRKDIIHKMGFHKNPKSLFVVHDIGFVEKFGIEDFNKNHHVLALGDFGKCLFVNPHYFGKIENRAKNSKTRFFITSTYGRKYTQLVEAAQNLKDKNMDFEIVVVGRSTTFSADDIPNNLKDNFIFKHRLPYKEMYEEVQNSDYILMLLDPNNEYDNIFKTAMVTGTAQLSYGFSKPVIVNKEFSEFYKFSNENSLIYEDGKLEATLEKAIKSNKNQYLEMQNNLKILANSIYEESLKNVQKALY